MNILSEQSCVECVMTHDALDVVIFLVNTVHLENVVAEVEGLKPALLTQEHNNGTASPVQSLPKQLSATHRAHVTKRGHKSLLQRPQVINAEITNHKQWSQVTNAEATTHQCRGHKSPMQRSQVTNKTNKLLTGKSSVCSVCHRCLHPRPQMTVCHS